MAQIIEESDSVEKRKSNTMISFCTQKFNLIIIILLAIIIFICTSFGVGIYISYATQNKNAQIPNDIRSTLNQPQIPGSHHKLIYRDEWGGRPPLYERPQKVPVKYVIISHTAGAECFSITACSKQMQQIQTMHVEANSPDAGYNFVISGDENIYVARGWDNHNFHMNLDTIGISFMGNYVYNELTPGMIEAAIQLLKLGVEEGKLEKDYFLVAHNQTYNTVSPGPNVYKQIKFWPQFLPEILTDIE